ncbi:hypothetical protein OG552_29700 [Streptomyces sp. NBC_01476]|uniref:hypothetical protein n=1 Tax=Streptomyces sp. NBC_01476 TaxID=2903881 RepID=UPI002E380020|nr:hypothetical protein [Streptomyces sp. NBC_01476]
MSTEAVVAIAGAGVSAVAAGVAIWQALVAKEQARTAEDSALSARRQADAAEAQVQLMQRQIDGEEAERHDTKGPSFTFNDRRIDEDRWGQPRATVLLVQDSGPALSRVLVTASGQYVTGIRVDPDEMAAQPSLDFGGSSAGTALEICVGIEYRHVLPVQVTLRIDCTARGTGATWTRDVAGSVQRPPERRIGRTRP